MTLNIKNPETHRLAKELAALTGESVTAAVTEAVRERLARKRRDGIAERLMAIGRRTAPLMKGPWTSTNIGDLLYDERGLPK
jgi:antitoxin VapB